MVRIDSITHPIAMVHVIITKYVAMYAIDSENVILA